MIRQMFKSNTFIGVLLILSSVGSANAQWSTAGNSGSGLTLGLTSADDLNLFTNNQIRATITNEGDLGVGLLQPDARQEILYCPVTSNKDVGLIITHQECPGTNAAAFNPTLPDIIGFGVSGGTNNGEGNFRVPFSFLTGHSTNFFNPFYTPTKPIFWIRNERPANSTNNNTGFDAYDTKFIVMPDGSTGINVAQPRAALDVRGSQASDHPAAIFGSRAMGTGSTNGNNLYQYYTQQLHIVPILTENGYNRISQVNDQGLFFSDGKGIEGANLNGSLVIAPWAQNGDVTVGGMRMDREGNTEFHGTLRAINFNVNAKWWSDFVFAEDYSLMSLPNLKNYISEYHHLSGMPSESEVLDKGLDVAETLALQQQKIEELTLYILMLKKEIDQIKSEQ